VHSQIREQVGEELRSQLLSTPIKLVIDLSTTPQTWMFLTNGQCGFKPNKVIIQPWVFCHDGCFTVWQFKSMVDYELYNPAFPCNMIVDLKNQAIAILRTHDDWRR